LFADGCADAACGSCDDCDLSFESFGHVGLDALRLVAERLSFVTFAVMRKRWPYVCLAAVVTLAPDRGYAQFTDPRTYTNFPVDTNQIELLYAYARSNTSIDTSLIVGGAKFNLNQGNHYLHALFWLAASFGMGGTECSDCGTFGVDHRDEYQRNGYGNRGFELSVWGVAKGWTCPKRFGVRELQAGDVDWS
jgi:hypothetical protein